MFETLFKRSCHLAEDIEYHGDGPEALVDDGEALDGLEKH